MATNGYIYTHGHKTSASPDWCDAVLQGSNAVNATCTWMGGTGAASRIVAYATDADVVIVNDSSAIQVAYATLAGGFDSICYPGGDYLYLGVDGTGIYRLDISGVNYDAAGGDITPGGWAIIYNNGSAPALFSNNVVSLYGWQDASDHDWLAVACCDNAGTGNDRVTIVDTNGAASYDSASWCFAKDLKIKGFGGSEFKVSSGNFLNTVYDGESPGLGLTDDFAYDATPTGSFDDAFTDNSLIGWQVTVEGTCAVAEQNTQLETSVTAAVAGNYYKAYTRRTGMISGDFDVSIKQTITSDYDALMTAGRYAGSYLNIYFPHSGSDGIQIERRICKGSYNRLYSNYFDEGGIDEYYFDFTPNTFWVRIVRSGSAITTYYKQTEEAGWTQHREYTDCATTPASIELQNYTNDAAYTHLVNYDNLATDFTDNDTCYSNSLPNEKINDFALADGTSVAGTTVAALGFASGAWMIDTDESTPKTSESGGYIHGDYTTATGGGAYDVIAGASDSVTAISCSVNAKADTSVFIGGESGAGHLVVATSGGISSIGLADDTRQKHLSSSYTVGAGQPLVSNVVSCLTRCGSYAYGADTGGGWFAPDATAASDVQLNGRHFAEDKVALSWERPTDADWLFSRMYRRGVFSGSGAWQELKTDGFGGSGSAVVFDGSEDGSLGYYDTSITADDHYEYKVTQIDQAGNESAGTIFAAYCDEPVIAAVTIKDPSTGDTDLISSRGVLLEVAGHSGPDSQAPHAIEWIQIKEGAPSSYTNSPYYRYAEGMSYPFVVSELNGAKTLYVRGYSQAAAADMTGASDGTASITLSRQSAASTRRPVGENMVLAYDFAGDGGIVTDYHGDANFPPTNVLEPDLGVKWQAADTDAHLDFDLIGVSGLGCVVKYIAIAGHNFHLFAGSNFSLRIRYKLLPGESYTNVDISALASNDMIVVDMQSAPARYVRLDMIFNGITINNFTIGRVIIAAEGEQTIQPTGNFRQDIQWSSTARYTAFHESASTRFAANHCHPRQVEISLDDFTPDDRQKLFTAFEFVGRHQPVLWLGKPEVLPTRADPQWAQPDDAERANNFALYGYFDDDRQAWTMAANEYGRTTLRLREAVE